MKSFYIKLHFFVPINFYFLSLISENVITFYESIDFLKAYSDEIRQFLSKDKSAFKAALKMILAKSTTANKKFLHKEKLFSLLKEKYSYYSNKENLKLINEEEEKYEKEHRKETFRINYSPICIFFAKPVYEITNRVMRKYSSNEQMIRFTLKSTDGSQLRSKCDLVQIYTQFILIKGITINKVHYDFFGYSNSQFRSASCWMSVNAEEIRSLCGDFSNLSKELLICRIRCQIRSKTWAMFNINQARISN